MYHTAYLFEKKYNTIYVYAKRFCIESVYRYEGVVLALSMQHNDYLLDRGKDYMTSISICYYYIIPHVALRLQRSSCPRKDFSRRVFNGMIFPASMLLYTS